jgi:hypothetical protein
VRKKNANFYKIGNNQAGTQICMVHSDDLVAVIQMPIQWACARIKMLALGRYLGAIAAATFYLNCRKLRQTHSCKLKNTQR